MAAGLTKDLQAWFVKSGRDLPWRRTPDPYAIWISEVMLQQTRVETAVPYYERFIKRFPDVRSLAAASEEEVLRLWEGLGYYSRARHLHQAATQVVARFGGRIPESPDRLQELPGVGRYTAAAVAAIAFGQDTLALDGNLRRVLARLFGIHLDPRSPAGGRELQRHAAAILPRGKASEFNQGLMDLGALICKPRAPACPSCPLARYCLARRRGTQEQLPVRGPRRSVPDRLAVAAVWEEDGKVLIRRNPSGGLLAGLWGFPGGLLAEGEDERAGLTRLIQQQLEIQIRLGDPLPRLKHSYTHFRVTLQPFRCQAAGRRLRKRAGTRWVGVEQLGRLPMGKLDRRLAERLTAV
jgi:A/G-specific adenine glycosylase